MNKFRIKLLILLAISITACDSIEDKKGRFLLKGNEKLDENDPRGALEFYQEALDLDSTYSDAWYNKALAHLQLNQLDEAILDFSEAINYKIDYSEAYFQRGLTYLDNGEFYKAREDANWLQTNQPNEWKGFFLGGLVQEKLQNYELALEAFGKALELNPDNSDLIVNQATIFYYQKNYAKADSLLGLAKTINPMEPNLHNLESMIAFDRGNYQMALDAVEKAISLNTSQAYFYNNKGLYLLYLGQMEEGLEFINRSLKMDGNNPFALRNKGIYYVLKGDKISALQYLQELYRDYPEMDLVAEYYQKAQKL